MAHRRWPHHSLRPSIRRGDITVASSHPGARARCEHEGIEKTLHRLRADFHIPGERDVVHDFVRTYEVCQRNKGE
jgi:hypothetical protein